MIFILVWVLLVDTGPVVIAGTCLSSFSLQCSQISQLSHLSLCNFHKLLLRTYKYKPVERSTIYLPGIVYPCYVCFCMVKDTGTHLLFL